MERAIQRGPFWLAVVGGLLLLPKALGSAATALSGWPPSDKAEALAIFWFVVPLLLVGVMVVAALVVRSGTSRPKLWGWLILVSGASQFATGWSPLGDYADFWLPAGLEWFAVPSLLLGGLCSVMSGSWLIVEQRGSPEQT